MQGPTLLIKKHPARFNEANNYQTPSGTVLQKATALTFITKRITSDLNPDHCHHLQAVELKKQSRWVGSTLGSAQ